MSNPQILVVEDEGIVATDIQDRLISLGYEVPATVSSGDEAIATIPSLSPDLVLIDIMLQGEKDGIQAATEIREKFELPVVFLTAHAEESTLNRAKLAEPYGYILKPFEEKDLQSALEVALHKHRMDRERAKIAAGDRECFARTMEATVKTLSKILSVADPQAFAFGKKISEYVRTCAQTLELEQVSELETAALLCRVGILTIPPVVVQKIRAGMTLSPAEKDSVNRLPEYGRNLLSAYPTLEAVGKIVYYQNKSFNGTGFPSDGVGGINIPLGGRLLKILVDLAQFESEGQSKRTALDRMKVAAGQYDPKLLQKVATAASCGPRKGRAILLKDLVVGQTLVEPIETNDGVLVLNAGNKLTPWMLQKLTNFVQLGIREPIYVER